MGRFRLGAVACACLLLAACGGTTTRQASIRRATANRLAGESDALAAALQRRDSCGAASRARALRRQVANAISTGSIPRSLAAPARRASSRLAFRVVCTRPPAPTPPPPASVSSTTCKGIEGPKKALEGEKHGHAKHGKGHSVDEQRQGCE